MSITDHLENALKKQQLLRDRVTGLVTGLETGLIVYGPGGTGKTYIIDEHLNTLNVSFKKINSHVTPMAMFLSLQQYRDEIVVLEDCECLLRSTISLGILRSATFPSSKDRQGNPIRNVDYYHGHKLESFLFCGRIIMLMNRGLADIPEAEALASRINCIEFTMSNAEIAALMRHLAAKGLEFGEHTVTPDECLKVVEFMLARASEAGRLLNLRMMQHAINDYVQYEELKSGLSWQDLVTSAVNRQPSIIDSISLLETREKTRDIELDLVRSLGNLPQEEKLAEWKAKTGKSQSAFYRRLKMLAAMEHNAFV